jgi:hypothetical protein
MCWRERLLIGIFRGELDRLDLADSRGSLWRKIAAVGKPGPCREGKLTGAVANSHYRPTPVAR